MPSPTYTLIASNTLGASAASVTFSSIPSTYTDLVLRWSARADGSTTPRPIYIEFNGSTSLEYSDTFLYGNSSTAASSKDTGNAFLAGLWTNGTAATTNAFSSHELYIPNYTASANKPISIISVTETNASTADSAYIAPNASLWRNTNAITQIKFTTSPGSFISGSSFYLYGIRSS